MSDAGYCYYKSARDEIIIRLRLRNQILLSFIVSSGALLGVALSGIGSTAVTIALAVPFLAFEKQWGQTRLKKTMGSDSIEDRKTELLVGRKSMVGGMTTGTPTSPTKAIKVEINGVIKCG